ncbi:MAG: fold metallo-hydrolase [Bacilli bacterium]|nr:fold metallo-hydrolase [Bacilli bacterium]
MLMQQNKGLAVDEILQIKAPLPFPLRWVNSYMVRGSKGITLIDPGLHTPEAQQFWEKTLTEHGLRFEDIEQIVLTHHHPDHYGLTGWFQERCNGAPVWMSQAGHEQVLRLWGEGQPLTAEICRLFIRHGMDAAMAKDQLMPHMNSFVAWVSPQPQVSFINLDVPFRLGDRFFQPIVTPGHAAGHICFYDPERKDIFCGDHVLPQISPNVSYIPGADENPLRSFLLSLQQISSLEVAKAYPGHREPFVTFNARIHELIDHHQDRLEKMRIHLKQPMHVYQLCLDFFGRGLQIHQLRFALSETLAHVIYLHQAGRLLESERDGVLYYSNV